MFHTRQPTWTPQEGLFSILARRDESGLISLDRALLYSPIIAGCWHSFFGVIYFGSILRADLLELAICRVTLLNRAWYQYDGHITALRRCEDSFGKAKNC
ncbi:LOW QUALITY PROTEIN: hypothetical protein MKX08_005861 [Trichoderma sp. CBMAI-0020]|nr:LOW QUALITY PROTEIN: hypothetical protein MKX08_005861 [Trichoderma sp. CBMAI-0020]